MFGVISCVGLVFITAFVFIKLWYENNTGYNKKLKSHKNSYGGLIRWFNGLVRFSNQYFKTSFFVPSEERILKKMQSMLEKENIKQKEFPNLLLELTKRKIKLIKNHLNNRKIPRISPMGAFVIQKEHLDQISAYCKVLKYIETRDNNKIPNIDSFGPIIITGLPRTGSTFLHHLLSLDEKNRSFTMWEMIKPVPPPKPETYKKDQRLFDFKNNMKKAEIIFPGLNEDVFGSHLTGDLLPEECLSIFNLYGYNVLLDCVFDDNNYSKWIENNREIFAEILDFHKLVSQVLLEEKYPLLNGKLILKFPAYSLMIDHILNTYPNAKFIFTHRDPVKVVPSCAKVIHPVCKMHLDYCNLFVEGNNTFRMVKSLSDNLLQLRSKLNFPLLPLDSNLDGSSNYVDLHMDYLCKEPEKVIEQIYQVFDIGPLSDEYREKIKEFCKPKDYIKSNDEWDYAPHLPSTWGLEENIIKEEFKDYIDFIKPISN